MLAKLALHNSFRQLSIEKKLSFLENKIDQTATLSRVKRIDATKEIVDLKTKVARISLQYSTLKKKLEEAEKDPDAANKKIGHDLIKNLQDLNAEILKSKSKPSKRSSSLAAKALFTASLLIGAPSAYYLSLDKIQKEELSKQLESLKDYLSKVFKLKIK